MIKWLLILLALLLMPLFASRSSGGDNALLQCESLIKVKSEMQANTEHLAALLLRRAEKAEQELAQLRTKEHTP